MSSLPWLPPASDLALTQLVQELQYLDPIPSQKKAPLRFHHLVRISALVLASAGPPPSELLFLLLLWMAYEGIMRLDALIRPFQVMDVIWGPRWESFQLWIFRDKNHRSGPGYWIEFHLRPGYCAVRFMLHWFHLNSLHSFPTALLFPSLRTSSSGCVSASWMRITLKAHVANIGLNPAFYSGHSPRSGGTTDLFLLKVPYPFIKLHGHWKSDVCLEYFQNQAEVSSAIHHAFSRLARTVA